MRPVDVIFFDIGDTLVYDVPSIEDRLWTAAQACEIAFPRERLTGAFRAAETVALAEYVQGRPPETPEVAQAMLTVLLAEAGAPDDATERIPDLIAEYRRLPFERVAHAEAVPLIVELRRRGFRIGVISDWEPDLGDLLAQFGILPLLDALAVSAIVGVTKPAARLFQSALAEAGADPATSLHIGDFYELDIAGAHAAGMQALLLDARCRVPAFAPRVESFAELRDALLSLPAPK